MKIDFEALPDEAVTYIAQLRREASGFRLERNGARAEADRLRARVAELESALQGN